MGFQCGIVGLPNVGKSTIFNALTSAKAEAANYPFCTIDPNTGIVRVPDPRLARIAEYIPPNKLIPATMTFVDIAGLVKGASKGEGLGNQFLGHIRETNAVAHVVRCFQDPNVIHVDGTAPLADLTSTGVSTQTISSLGAGLPSISGTVSETPYPTNPILQMHFEEPGGANQFYDGSTRHSIATCPASCWECCRTC